MGKYVTPLIVPFVFLELLDNIYLKKLAMNENGKLFIFIANI